MRQYQFLYPRDGAQSLRPLADLTGMFEIYGLKEAISSELLLLTRTIDCDPR
jgi:hypothetical protein